MYNTISASKKRKQLPSFEDEPPDKKLVSDADLFIKQLAEKQMQTNLNLKEQLLIKKEFYKATEFVSLSKYTAGSSTLSEFNESTNYTDEIEKLKSFGLNNGDIELFLDNKKGKDFIKSKHKNYNETVFEQRLNHINTIIEKYENNISTDANYFSKNDRLQTEMVLSEKPESVETKLLKFALDNQNKSKVPPLPHPMDELKEIEQKFNDNLFSPIDIKKIRKKARQFDRQINAVTDHTTLLKEPKIKPQNSALFLGESSKWDMKEYKEDIPEKIVEKKVYSCKPQNFYTIRDGKIVKLDSATENKVKINKKISVEEIKKIAKFENYAVGEPSKTLYLKNLANGIMESDLNELFCNEKIISVKIMQGKLRGQAFIKFESEELARRALEAHNGTILKNRPIIMQFGKRKT